MNKILISAFLFFICTQILISQETKPTILILDVVSIDVEESQSKIIQNYIFDQVHRSGGYVLVERSQLEKAFEEMELSMSGAVDDETAVEIGKITGAEYILLSSLAFSDGKYHISMRVVSVATTKITNTSVKSAQSFSNVDKLVEETVSYLLGAGLEKKPVDHYFTLDIGFSLGFPLDPVADVLRMAYVPKAEISYNFGFPWGALSGGLLIGSTLTSTLEDTIVAYNLYSVLVAGSIGYRTNFNSPFFLRMKTSPGAAFSFLIYPESETGGDPKTFSKISFSIMSEIGAGFSINSTYSVYAFGSFIYTMFNADDYIAVSPGIGLTFRF